MFRDILTGESRSADERARDKGSYASSGRGFAATFLCRASSPLFCSDSSESQAGAVASIKKEIDCGSFIQWQPAKTAEEHEAMTILQQVEARQAAWRDEERSATERRHQEQLAWRREVEEYAREQQAKSATELAKAATEAAEEAATNRREDRAAARFQFWATIAMSLAALIVSIVSAYISIAAK